jgi:sugar phosphate permease
MIENHGWRTAAVVAGIVLVAVGIPVALVMRRRPEDYGLLPDGVKPAPPVSESSSGETLAAGASVEVDEGPEMTPWQALKTPVFWFLGLSISMRGMVTSGMVVHVVAMMQDRGMSLTVASTMLASVATISIVGRLGIGWLGDIWDKRLLMAGTMAALTLAMIGMSLVTVLIPMLCILAVYAVAYGGTTVLPMSLQADLFGRKSYATIRGLVHTVQMTGMLLGPVFAGFVYDNTESYFLAFVGFAIAGFVGMVAILLTLIPRFGPVAQPAPSEQRKGM